MKRHELLSELAIQTPSRIVFLIIDGLGGIPGPDGKTELEAAQTPNLDLLAGQSLCGLTDPVSPGITPGSGPSHLALFGYDPLEFQVGRGVLEALGIEFPLKATDVAIRANFCTVDEKGVLTDRRAGRLGTVQASRLCQMLRDVRLVGAEALIEPVKEHRFVVIFRGDGLASDVADTDPQRTGVPPLEPRALTQGAERTANLARDFIRQARTILEGQPANMVMLRGFSRYPSIPSLPSLYKLHPAAIALYPMYRGLARLVGMDVLAAGGSLDDEVETLRANWGSHDFFYFHVKDLDRTGEDGDFQGHELAVENYCGLDWSPPLDHGGQPLEHEGEEEDQEKPAHEVGERDGEDVDDVAGHPDPRLEGGAGLDGVEPEIEVHGQKAAQGGAP